MVAHRPCGISNVQQNTYAVSVAGKSFHPRPRLLQLEPLLVFKKGCYAPQVFIPYVWPLLNTLSKCLLSSPLISPTLFYGPQEESAVKLKSIKKKQVVLTEHDLHKS